MEHLAKILEFLGKFSWAVMIAAAFLLFIPDDAAKQIGLIEVRDSYKGLWWLVMVVAAAIWIGAIFSYLDRRLLDGWMKDRAARREAEAKRSKRLEDLRLRLNSLDEDEQMWIKYCLFHNVQTLYGELTNNTAQSLVFKNIVSQGSGHMLTLPFHLRDDVWRYLLDNADDFLSQEERTNPSMPKTLEAFRKSLFAGF